jgi:hypothetical protein
MAGRTESVAVGAGATASDLAARSGAGKGDDAGADELASEISSFRAMPPTIIRMSTATPTIRLGGVGGRRGGGGASNGAWHRGH